ncbi:2-hydroxyacid dehydrogenase [Capnocytophaga stomatis]|uniref:2-hydroxyacid dehydrogenase n=1 Tax=Capnocytophaga stomatis TaxID=1848904 RepID=UPI001AC86CF9|nr:2-hydroxyacid dehydrogenase [Capnocytophaga stomatis]GIM50847.1 2-hydroxyacid dehydrogenase [Capnocytophaga stomatis]
MKILHLDTNHPLMIAQLAENGFENYEDYKSSKSEIESKIHLYDGIILRSRFSIDRSFIEKATNLKFIARVGAGLENIDCEFAESKGVMLISSPEGNRNAVGEHTLGMLLALLNKFKKANTEIERGKWLREENRGWELDYKTVGIIGYGNMGKSFAKKLKGFDCKVICYDIKPNVGDENATQVSLEEFFSQAEVVSLHTPQTPLTMRMVNTDFINKFSNPFWFLNTARGKSVVTDDLVSALKSGKILGAGLDVLEYEKSSFEDFFTEDNFSEAFRYLLEADNVILTPHIAGWTMESKEKLAQVIVDKIVENFKSK